MPGCFQNAPAYQEFRKIFRWIRGYPRICLTPSAILVKNTPAMIRRTFFERLSGAFLPRPIWNSNHPRQSLSARPVGGVPPLPVSPDPEWLTEWMRLPRLPLLADDLPEIADPRERELAAQILQRIGSGNSFDFQYFGDSEPGKSRQVLPVLLFTTTDDMPCGVGHPDPIYLLAWCLSRKAPRTFRLDRMGIRHLPPIPPSGCSPES